MRVSDDTILRLLRRPAAAPVAPEPLRVLGMDDWAWQKGQHHYGTILVDLERRRVVDVLAVRTADAVATWLEKHSDIQIISRDRHGPYAEAVRRGAPHATQVADRFHLVLNLRGAVEQALSQQRASLMVPFDAPAPSAPPAPPDTPDTFTSPPPRRRRSAVLAQQQHIAQARRTAQLERFHLVKRLQAAGRTGQAIITEAGIGRASVRKWLRLRELPTRNRMAPQPGMVLDHRLGFAGRRSQRVLWRTTTNVCNRPSRWSAACMPRMPRGSQREKPRRHPTIFSSRTATSSRQMLGYDLR